MILFLRYTQPRMVSVSCRSLDFGPTGFDLVACGCSSNAQFDRFSGRNYAKGVSRTGSRRYAAKRLVYCQRGIGCCRVFSTRAPETMVHGTLYCFLFS